MGNIVTVILIALGAFFGMVMVGLGLIFAIAIKVAVIVAIIYGVYWGVDTLILQDMEKPVADYVDEALNKVQDGHDKGSGIDSIAPKEVK